MFTERVKLGSKWGVDFTTMVLYKGMMRADEYGRMDRCGDRGNTDI